MDFAKIFFCLLIFVSASRGASEDQRLKEIQRILKSYSWHDVLDVSSDANDRERAESYKKKAILVHPSKNENSDDSQDAFAILSDAINKKDLIYQDGLLQKNSPQFFVSLREKLNDLVLRIQAPDGEQDLKNIVAALKKCYKVVRRTSEQGVKEWKDKVLVTFKNYLTLIKNLPSDWELLRGFSYLEHPFFIALISDFHFVEDFFSDEFNRAIRFGSFFEMVDREEYYNKVFDFFCSFLNIYCNKKIPKEFGLDGKPAPISFALFQLNAERLLEICDSNVYNYYSHSPFDKFFWISTGLSLFSCAYSCAYLCWGFDRFKRRNKILGRVHKSNDSIDPKFIDKQKTTRKTKDD